MWLDVVHVLGYLAKTRYLIWHSVDTSSAKWLARAKVPFYYSLWISTIKLLEQVVAENLPITDNEQSDPRVWTELTTAFSNFLFYGDMTENSYTNIPEESSDEEEENERNSGEVKIYILASILIIVAAKDRDVMVIQLIERVCLPNSKTASKEVRNDLIQILRKASTLSPRPLGEESLRALFRLVAKGSEVAITDEQR